MLVNCERQGFRRVAVPASVDDAAGVAAADRGTLRILPSLQQSRILAYSICDQQAMHACNTLLRRQRPARGAAAKHATQRDFFCAAEGLEIEVRQHLDGELPAWLRSELQAALLIQDASDIACCHEVRERMRCCRCA